MPLVVQSRTRHWAVVAVVAALVGPSALPGTEAQSGGSWGVTPSTLAVGDALRGKSYVRTVTLQNELGMGSTVTIETGGAVGAWLATDPATGFFIADGAHPQVEITITVPAGASGSSHAGSVRFVSDPAAPPSGTGAAVRYSVSVPITVAVQGSGGGGGGAGGAAVVDLVWSKADAADVEAGSPPAVSVMLSNRGNVRATGAARAEVLGFLDDGVVVAADAALEVLPGATREVAFPFAEALPVGQYRARVTSLDPAGFSETRDFKVVDIGLLGKDGFFRGLLHPPSVLVGDTVRLSGDFVNTGNVSIATARLVYELWLGGRLVEAGTAQPLAVPLGRNVTLTAFFTPVDPGEHRVVAHVVYDGLITPSRESILTAQEEADVLTLPWWSWLVVAVPLLAGIAWIVAAMRRGHRDGPAHPSVAARMRRVRRR